VSRVEQLKSIAVENGEKADTNRMLIAEKSSNSGPFFVKNCQVALRIYLKAFFVRKQI